MAKLCPRGKAAAKRKFKVYPSAYANMYALQFALVKLHLVVRKKLKKLWVDLLIQDKCTVKAVAFVLEE